MASVACDSVVVFILENHGIAERPEQRTLDRTIRDRAR
jgi:hypothetical protein